jgi:DNA-binding IclR family transcriptional regulator
MTTLDEIGAPVDADLVARLRAEFADLSGLRLTVAQASRLVNAPKDRCARALEELAGEGVVWRRPDGRYARR